MLAAEDVVLVEPPAEPVPLPPAADPVAGADDGPEVVDGVADDGVLGAGVVVVDGVVVAGVVVGGEVVVDRVVVVVDGVVEVVVVVVLRRLVVVSDTNSLEDEPTVRLAPVALELEPPEDEEEDDPFSAAVS